MRSFTYLITKRPCNRSDCFDYHQTQSKVKSISLSLFYENRITIEYLIDYFLGKFTWIFEDGREVTYEEQLGGILFHESDARKKQSLDNANRRLDAMIKDIEERAGVSIERETQEFVYNIS